MQGHRLHRPAFAGKEKPIIVTATGRAIQHDTRVLVAADQPLEGRALKLLLESAGYEALDVESVARAGRLLGSGRKEILLWAARRFDTTAGAEVLELRRHHRDVGLCLLASGAEPSALRALVSENAEGIAFLNRARRPGQAELVDALTSAANGRSTLEPAALAKLVDETGTGHGSLEWLTGGEREVLELVAHGLRNEAIASRLCKSEKTIEKRVSQVFAKLGLNANAHPHLDRRVMAARIFLAGDAGEERAAAAAPGDAGELARPRAG